MFYLNALFAISLYLFVKFTITFWVKFFSQSFLTSMTFRSSAEVYCFTSLNLMEINIHVAFRLQVVWLIKQKAINKANLTSISVAIKPDLLTNVILILTNLTIKTQSRPSQNPVISMHLCHFCMTDKYASH